MTFPGTHLNRTANFLIVLFFPFCSLLFKCLAGCGNTAPASRGIQKPVWSKLMYRGWGQGPEILPASAQVWHLETQSLEGRCRTTGRWHKVTLSLSRRLLCSWNAGGLLRAETERRRRERRGLGARSGWCGGLCRGAGERCAVEGAVITFKRPQAIQEERPGGPQCP